MPATIGAYVYLFEVYPMHGQSKVAFNSSELATPPSDVMHAFVANHKDAVLEIEDQRVWFFQDPVVEEPGEIDGYINYGTYGFESDFIDAKTKEKKYKREVDHYEDIPLFYQMWIPEGKNYGLMLFQSFSGRSCSGRVRHRFRAYFMSQNEGYGIRYRKLLPGDAGGAYAEAPVTGFSFVKRRSSADKFDDYGQSDVPDEVEIEVQVTAKKKGSWGPFGTLDPETLRKEASVIFLPENETFDRAVASVRMGKKSRRLAVFGRQGEAGSIDITDDVTFMASGHPDLASLQSIGNELLSDFQKGIA